MKEILEVEFLISKYHQDKGMFDQVAKLKEKVKQKLDIVEKPAGGKECVIILEETVENSYVAEVGIGTCWKFPTSYDIIGKVYTEMTGAFNNSTIKIYTKDKNKNRKITIGVAEPGFIRKIDEAIWDGKFKNLDDLIEILENLY